MLIATSKIFPLITLKYFLYLSIIFCQFKKRNFILMCYLILQIIIPRFNLSQSTVGNRPSPRSGVEWSGVVSQWTALPNIPVVRCPHPVPPPIIRTRRSSVNRPEGIPHSFWQHAVFTLRHICSSGYRSCDNIKI